MEIADLPAVNATLNGLAAIFLTTGYVLIRRGYRELHKRCMLAALTTSALFQPQR
jgi:putative membrane protein